MALEKLFETAEGVNPSIIVYRNSPDQLFVEFQDEGMSLNDFTVDDVLLQNNDMHSVHDYEKNIDKRATKEQREAFQLTRDWLVNKK